MKSKTIFYLVIAGITILSLIGIGAMASSKNQEKESKRNEIFSISDKDWIYAKNDSKVTLIEYLDFQCPACANAYPMVSKIKEEYKDKIQYIVRHYPLSSHPYGFEASQTAEAAGLQGKFWEMHDLLFKNQKNWATAEDVEATFRTYAQELGLDINKFDVDYASQVTLDRIKSDSQNGSTIGVNSTPTFFLNNRKIDNPGNIEEFRRIIDEELSKQK